MQPPSPHEVPHEFLIFQLPPTKPTKRTAWLMELAQLLKIPLEYLLQLVASTVTDTGLLLMAFWRATHPLAEEQEEILKLPPVFLQEPVTAVQGYSDSVERPWSFTQLRAAQGQPPLQPWFPQEAEQSTSCCSDRLMDWPWILALASRTPVAEKAQHEPHWPWFLTGETPPLAVQSMSALMGAMVSSGASRLRGLGSRQVLSNSSWVMAVNWLMPILQVWVWSALCLLMMSTFLLKTILLYSCSPAAQLAPYWLFQASKSLSLLDSAAKKAAPATTATNATSARFLFMLVGYLIIILHEYIEIYSNPQTITDGGGFYGRLADKYGPDQVPDSSRFAFYCFLIQYKQVKAYHPKPSESGYRQKSTICVVVGWVQFDSGAHKDTIKVL